jgi:hypothetical protein
MSKQSKLSEDEKEFLRKAERITQEISRRIIQDANIERTWSDAPQQKEIMRIDEAAKKYMLHELRNHHEDKNAVTLIIHGDVCMKGNMDKAWVKKQLKNMTWKGQLSGAVIDGNVVLDGDVIDDDYLELFITKSLECSYLYSENGWIEIHGDLKAKFGIYGEYNDGRLQVKGKVYSPYLIASDHDMPRSAEGEFIHMEGGKGTEKEYLGIGSTKGSGWGWNWNYYENSHELLLPGVWDKEGGFDVDKFFEIVRQGKNPFKKIS